MTYLSYSQRVTWNVELHDDFVPEYNELPEEVQDELLAVIEVLEQIGPAATNQASAKSAFTASL